MKCEISKLTERVMRTREKEEETKSRLKLERRHFNKVKKVLHEDERQKADEIHYLQQKVQE
jgi:hypothetical protein